MRLNLYELFAETGFAIEGAGSDERRRNTLVKDDSLPSSFEVVESLPEWGSIRVPLNLHTRGSLLLVDGPLFVPNHELDLTKAIAECTNFMSDLRGRIGLDFLEVTLSDAESMPANVELMESIEPLRNYWFGVYRSSIFGHAISTETFQRTRQGDLVVVARSLKKLVDASSVRPEIESTLRAMARTYRSHLRDAGVVWSGIAGDETQTS